MENEAMKLMKQAVASHFIFLRKRKQKGHDAAPSEDV